MYHADMTLSTKAAANADVIKKDLKKQAQASVKPQLSRM